MIQVKSFLCGAWHYGQGREQTLYNPLTGEAIATACTDGIDLHAAEAYAKQKGHTICNNDFCRKGPVT